MTNEQRRTKSTLKIPHYALWGVASAVYIALTLVGPITGKTYGLPNTQIHLLQLTLVIPSAFIWFAAFYGAVRFKNYAATISKQGHDGHALNIVSNGLFYQGESLYFLVRRTLLKQMC